MKFLGEVLNVLLPLGFILLCLRDFISGWRNKEFKWRPIYGPKTFLYRRDSNPVEYWLGLTIARILSKATA